MSEFVKCLCNGERLSVDGGDGLLSLQIGLAAKKSLEKGRPVKIGEIQMFGEPDSDLSK